MFSKYALSYLTALFFFQGLIGQTIISNKLRIGDESQTHVLFTTDGHQFIGLTRFIQNDTIGFQIRNLPTAQRFLLAETRFLGLSSEGYTTVEGNEAVPEKQKADEFDESKYPMPLNQLIYSATGIPYASRGTYRNTMILVNQVDLQVSKNFGISGGVLIPALLMGRVQAQVSASDILHMGLAVQQYVILYDEQSATHPYAMVTVGDRERYLNFTMGYWFDRFGRNSQSESYPMVTLGGSFAFAKDWRFFVEGVAVFQTFDNLVLPSFNFSNKRRKSVLEFGILALPETDFPVLPLLSYQRIF